MNIRNLISLLVASIAATLLHPAKASDIPNFVEYTNQDGVSDVVPWNPGVHSMSCGLITEMFSRHNISVQCGNTTQVTVQARQYPKTVEEYKLPPQLMIRVTRLPIITWADQIGTPRSPGHSVGPTPSSSTPARSRRGWMDTYRGRSGPLPLDRAPAPVREGVRGVLRGLGF